jgi:hypothetical protein
MSRFLESQRNRLNNVFFKYAECMAFRVPKHLDTSLSVLLMNVYSVTFTAITRHPCIQSSRRFAEAGVLVFCHSHKYTRRFADAPP